jgi:hypothetical protein
MSGVRIPLGVPVVAVAVLKLWQVPRFAFPSKWRRSWLRLSTPVAGVHASDRRLLGCLSEHDL